MTSSQVAETTDGFLTKSCLRGLSNLHAKVPNCEVGQMRACERRLSLHYKREGSLQRRILTSVSNLSDCKANRIIISKPNLLLFEGMMRHIPGPKALTEVWENDPQSVCVFMQFRCQNDKRNRRLLQRPSECLFGFRSLKADDDPENEPRGPYKVRGRHDEDTTEER